MSKRPTWHAESVVTLWILSVVVLLSVAASYNVWGVDSTPATPAAPPSTEAPSAATPSTPPDQQMQEHRGRMKEGMHRFRKACEVDVKQFCPNVKPGGGRILQCLDEHSKEVSDSCYDMLEKRAERRK